MTKAEKRKKTKAQGTIRGNMKGVIVQNGNTHKERQNKERWEGGGEERRGAKKGEVQRHQSESCSDHFALPITTSYIVAGSFEAQKPLRELKGLFFNKILIRCKTCVTLLPTFNHLHLSSHVYTIKTQTQHANLSPRLLTLLVLILRW